MSGHSQKSFTVNLKVWRQKGPGVKGGLVDYVVKDVSPDMSFLEMFDVLNQDIIKKGEDPIAFDHDCREGICGSCAMTIDGAPHGPDSGTAVCQLHMRRFKDGDTLVVEPFRAKAFPIVKDLATNRQALDRIIAAGGYVSVATGNAPDGNTIPISKKIAELAMDAAACIGCGACVAACRNGSAMLFTASRVSQLALLPQGQAERDDRVAKMIWQMDEEDFGSCTNMGSCTGACPKGIQQEHIARLNREYMRATTQRREISGGGGEG